MSVSDRTKTLYREMSIIYKFNTPVQIPERDTDEFQFQKTKPGGAKVRVVN